MCWGWLLDGTSSAVGAVGVRQCLWVQALSLLTLLLHPPLLTPMLQPVVLLYLLLVGIPLLLWPSMVVLAGAGAGVGWGWLLAPGLGVAAQAPRAAARAAAPPARSWAVLAAALPPE